MKEKTYRAKRHDIVRKRQALNLDEVHHPGEKTKQIRDHIFLRKDLKILELFAGKGNLTKIHRESGDVEVWDKKLGTGDSFIRFHQAIADKKKYDVIDIDPYGFPNRLFPDIFLLMDKGIMFVTMPKPYVNILNGITQTHLDSYYGHKNPTLEQIQERMYKWGLCHWREIKFLSIIEFAKMWRFAIDVKKVSATDYTGVKNRPYKIKTNQLTMEL